jgi:hypothetical protein
MKYINVYELGREFGGPEEGGWWYDTGTYDEDLSMALPSSVPDDKVKAIAIALRDRLVQQARDNEVPRVYSVLYRGGRYMVRIEDEAGHDLPEERPYYQ